MTIISDEQSILNELEDILLSMDDDYQSKVEQLPLFQPAMTAALSPPKKRQLAGVLYHIRGHFHDFLWYLANFAPDSKAKRMILRNISEELGGDRMSHEAMYGVFAKEFGIDIHSEITSEEHNLPFVRQFNKSHMSWLSNHDWSGRLAAFSAYERLDNIDYANMYNLAVSLGTSEAGLEFFQVHTEVTHFQSTQRHLVELWEGQRDTVKKSMQFIYCHQLAVWKQLSQLIFGGETPSSEAEQIVDVLS